MCPEKLATGKLCICTGAACSLQPCLESSTARSQHKSASSQVRVENGIPGTEQKTSGNESISQTAAQAPVPKGPSAGLNRMHEWAPGGFTFWPWFCQSPGLVFRAPVTAPMPGAVPSSPQVKSWPAFSILSSPSLPHPPLPDHRPDLHTKDKTQIIFGRLKEQHLSNPGPCNSANRPAHCTKSLEALCLRAHGG